MAIQNAPTGPAPDRYLQRLRADASRSHGRPLRVDLLPVTRMPLAQAAVVAHGLLGTLGVVPLDVQPIEDESLSNLARSGLWFALANRSGVTNLPTFLREMVDLEQWRSAWAPGSQEAAGRLFTAAQLNESAYEAQPFGRDHAAFVNPHLAGPAGEPSSATRVVRPWLLKLLKSTRGAPAEFVQDVGFFVDELVDNVREHGGSRADGTRTHSLVEVSITSGGSGRRLHICVQDTGPGIVATARVKVATDLRRAAAPKLVSALLSGTAGSWGRARGLGLPRVWGIVNRNANARFWLATSTVRAAGVAGKRLTAKAATFDLQGTVVIATLPVP